MASTGKRALGLVVLALVTFACGSDGDTSSSGTTTPAGAAAGARAGEGSPRTSADCVEVTNPNLLDAVKTTVASAFPAGDGHWFVSTVVGATWYVTARPMSADRGTVLPMNEAARVTNPELGRNLAPGDARYGGHTDHDPGAQRSRECAAG